MPYFPSPPTGRSGTSDFRTNGNDACCIDQWRLFKNVGLIHREEMSNGMGWCLSTDPGDASGTWRAYTHGHWTP
ncbi:MAG: hypothetical protein OEQ28_09775 [Acidobacteriota bacterium]|nr:hypothetical protein [Acidobacteriota bacterium]